MPPALPRLSGKESLILDLLVANGEMYGLELVARSRRRLKRGTVYVTLARMKEKDLVRSRLDDAPPPGGGLPRRRYQPTAHGLRIWQAWAQVVRLLSLEPAP